MAADAFVAHVPVCVRLAIVSAVVLLFSCGVDSATVRQTAAVPTCNTPQCQGIANQILSQVDMAIDPCQDFEAFICRKWRAANPLTDSHGSVSSTGMVDQMVTSVVANQLAAADLCNAECTLGKARAYFASCVATVGQILRNIAESGQSRSTGFSQEAVFEGLVKSYMGPNRRRDNSAASDLFHVYLNLIDDMAAGVKSIPETLAALHLSGTGQPLFSLSAQNDPRDSSKVVLVLGPSRLTMPDKGMYSNVQSQAQLSSHIMQTLVSGAVLDATDNPQPILDRLVAMETRLAAVTPDAAELRNPATSSFRLPLSDLDGQLSDGVFSFSGYVKSLCNDLGATLDAQVACPNVVFGSVNMTYFEVVRSILAEQPLEDIAMYFRFKLLDGIRASIGKPAGSARLLPTEIAEKTCVKAVDAVFPLATGRFYVEAVPDAAGMRTRATKMIEDILLVYADAIKTSDWLDAATATQALDKLNRLEFNKIGYPDAILNDELLDQAYQMFTVSASAPFLANYLPIMKQQMANQLAAAMSAPVLNQPVALMWPVSPSTVNAFYNAPTNEVVVPLAILNPPFYSDSALSSLIYGGIGAVIGHEIGHAFDDAGSQYDASGALRDWWTPSDRAQYEAKAQCFANQYSQLTVNIGNGQSGRVDGRLTLGENIADNAGITQTLRAFLKTYSEQPDPQIPGLPFTPEQLFFIGYGRLWCGSQSPSANQMQLLGPHSPSYWRMLVPLKNNPAFAAAFKCPAGSPMSQLANPCTLW